MSYSYVTRVLIWHCDKLYLVYYCSDFARFSKADTDQISFVCLHFLVFTSSTAYNASEISHKCGPVIVISTPKAPWSRIAGPGSWALEHEAVQARLLINKPYTFLYSTFSPSFPFLSFFLITRTSQGFRCPYQNSRPALPCSS